MIQRPKGILGIVVLVVLASAVTGASAFEIRPLGCTGAYGDVNTDKLVYTAPGSAVSPCGIYSKSNVIPVDCRHSSYITHIRGNQPVHEAITRQAYLVVRRKPISAHNFSSPWVAGVVWNDDPEWLLRKLIHENGFKKLQKFASAMRAGEENPSSERLMIRSHFGDLQFLHAMQGPGQSEGDFRRSMRAWLQTAHAVAIGQMHSTVPLRQTALGEILGRVACPLAPTGQCRTFRELLDPDGSKYVKQYREPMNETYIANMAAGTILHILQDAYSRSHTNLKMQANGSAIRTPQSYDAENRVNHCILDMATTDTEEDIRGAREASIEYLRLWQSKAGIGAVLDLFSRIGLDLR